MKLSSLLLACFCLLFFFQDLALCQNPSGQLDDAKCDVESVETANTEQLHRILSELVNTTYFRLMHIKLDGKCLYFDQAVSEAKCASTQQDSFSSWASSFSSPAPPVKEGGLCSLDVGNRNEESSQSSNPFDFGRPITNKVDKTISKAESESLLTKDESCNDPSVPDFWLDMCRNIPTNASEYVNLRLNPERWTGYNGSHVWDAIYNENCFEQLGSLDEMCYEERVLYRLLSGMHASINIHISLSYFPPSKSQNRSNWEPNPERFINQYGSRPEYLKNLHFAFVVLLRALRRASPFLYNHHFVTGDDQDDAHTTMLIRRLLDSSVMSSCQKVFDAFDESLMFSMDGEPSVKTTLKSQWKGVFHNISSVMDCISCQKCRLHGKIQLLGLGTALKVLLLPEQLIMASLERAEIVALFNTLSKFSTAIRGIQTLTNKFYEYQTLYKSDVLDDSIVTSRSAQGPSLQSKSSQQVEPPPSSDRQTSQTAALVDRAIGAVAAAAKAGKLSMQVEQKLLDALLRHDSTALLLAKHFIDGNSTNRFLVHAERNLHLMDSSSSSVTSFSTTDTDTSELDALKQGKDGATTADDTSQQRITSEELANHATEESCWVSINQKVYDFTQFLPEHPAGSEAILRIAGKDATSEYFAVHTAEMLTDFKPIGVLA